MIVLIDTGAFYALADDSDRNASAARSFFRAHLDAGHFVTTDAILFESWTLIRSRLGWDAARRFSEGVRASAIPVLFVDTTDLELAWRILTDYADQRFSLTDALSFAIMERHGVTDAFTFDKDFILYRYGPKKRRSFTCWPAR